MRKASDSLVMLLGARGRARGRGRSVVGSWLQPLQRWFGASTRRRSPDLVTRPVPGWMALGAAFLCFGAGFLTGDWFREAKAAGPGAGLQAAERTGNPAAGQANGPTVPGPLDAVDATPLARQAFIVAVYPGIPAAQARQKAKALSDFLQGQKVPKARPYEFPAKDGSKVWTVAVYYATEKEEQEQRQRLRDLPAEVPDPVFVTNRKTAQDWPNAWEIR